MRNYISIFIFWGFSFKSILGLSKENLVNNKVDSLIKNSIKLRDEEEYGLSLNTLQFALLNSYTSKDTANMARCFNTIGTVYLLLNNNKTALSYFLRSLKLKSTNTRFSVAAEYGNIATVYKKIKSYNNAIKYNLMAIKEYKKTNSNIGIAITYNNLSNIYSEINNPNEGILFQKKALEIYINCNDTVKQAVSYINIGGLFLDIKKHNEAEFYTKKGLTLFKYLNLKEYQKLSTYQLCFILLETNRILELESLLKDLKFTKEEIESNEDLLKIYFQLNEKEKKFERSLYYLKKYKSLTDSLNENDKSKEIADLLSGYELQNERQKNNLKNKELENEKINSRNKQIIIFALILFIVLCFWLIILELRKRKSQLLIERKDKEITRLSLVEKENLLIAAEIKLKKYTDDLLEKIETISLLEKEKNKIETEIKKEVNEEQLSEILHSKILSSEDWYKFKQLFNQVYPSFIEKLNHKIPELTPGDLRLFLLIKLSLKTTDISNLLGISFESVKKAKYRLKKKLELTEEDSLEAFIKSIDI